MRRRARPNVASDEEDRRHDAAAAAEFRVMLVKTVFIGKAIPARLSPAKADSIDSSPSPR